MNDNILYIVNKLKEFWSQYNIDEIPSFCASIGAATYHSFCLISALSKKTYNSMYLNACIRHDDSTNTNNKAFHRYIQHYQFQVIWKNAPYDILTLYKKSLEYIGFNFDKQHNLKFHDSKWETLSMGAFGYGYDVYINDLEITQFTYFQSICDIKINESFVEIAYGVERLAIALWNKKIQHINWSKNIPYNILRLNEEQHKSAAYSLISLDNQIDKMLNNVAILIANKLYAAALHEWLKVNDHFNELNARHIFTEMNKKTYLQLLRKYANEIGQQYYNDLTCS